MPRPRTGARTTTETLRLELSHLLKFGYLQKGKRLRVPIRWTCDGRPSAEMQAESHYTEEEAYVRLRYTHTDSATGRHSEQDYRIQLQRVPSNLGKGETLYFICPESGRWCRILFMAYGYPRFKSRLAYRHRIYYPTQICSKRARSNTRFFDTKHRLDKLDQMRAAHLYRGRRTKRSMKTYELEVKYWCLDRKRMSAEALGTRLMKALQK